MNDKIMQMMLKKKKEGNSLSDSDKKSKLEALMGMRGLADSHMGNKLKNLKKVTVASNSPEGLQAGLKKAEDLTSQDPSIGDDHSEDMAKLSDGGDVKDNEDGHEMKMPEGFDTDEDDATEEAEELKGNDEVHPGLNMGSEGEEQPESIDEIVEDADHLDVQQLEELIKKLQMKKASL